MKTAHSFHAVVDDILNRQLSFDAIIATGDLSQDHSPRSYQRFVDAIAPLNRPCFWLPGNHDDHVEMQNTLNQSGVASFDLVLLGAHWLLILLDTQDLGYPHGQLTTEQAELLTQALAQHGDRHTMIAMHHHPLPAGSAWLDQHQLKNANVFWSLIRDQSQVKCVLCGHIHQIFDRLFQQTRVIATPSTCIQFLPNSDQFLLDRVNPGWREIALHPDGSITTQVGRISGEDFLPDMNASGY